MSQLQRTLLLVISLLLALSGAALALQPPSPGMLEQMEREGILEQAKQRAKELGTWELKAPRRGTLRTEQLSDSEMAAQIDRNLGASIEGAEGRAVSSMATRELDHAALDLNNDGTVDERDLLALGLPRPKEAAEFPSLGTVNTFVLLLEFDEYQAWFPQEEIYKNMFDPVGEESLYFKSLRKYYFDSSFGRLDIQGEVYGWHHASQPRSYYHPDDNNSYPTDGERRNEVVMEAITAADAEGADFSQYDNDGDGYVDYFLVIWAGPNGAWSTFWWGYFGVSLPGDFVVDGVRFNTYSWQWERYHYFTDIPPEPEHWDPYVTIHETGHSLGLPDYYDYDGNQGPDGGCGGLDMMDGNWGDHGCFSKYWLGWIEPDIAFSNLNDHPMGAAASTGDAVIFMPGFDPVAPWAEYFMAQNRFRTGWDSNYPADGLIMWHVDSRVNAGGGFNWNNSYSSHKLLRLMEADGLEEIENGIAGANAGDFYNSSEELNDTSIPSSKRYNSTSTNARAHDISADGELMTADFTLFSSNPPSVTIDAPAASSLCSGALDIVSTSSDDAAVVKVQTFVDGELINSNTSGNSQVVVPWNSLVEYNRDDIEILVRAWDAEGQSGSASITVEVSNAGLIAVDENFESSLFFWRSQHYPLETSGHSTQWGTRTTPNAGNPPAISREGWVEPLVNNQWCNAFDGLRTHRINTAGYTRELQVTFRYRSRDGLRLEYTTDEGQSYVRAANLPATESWTRYTTQLPLQGGHVYLRLHYQGQVRNNRNSGWGANIDDFLARETPSDPPTLNFTSPADGASVNGLVDFTVDAADDVGVQLVRFFVNGAEVLVDTEAPYVYSRDTLGEDNIPNVEVSALAEDGDYLFSATDLINVTVYNPRPYPVRDDLEVEGTDGWALNNDALQPQWEKLGNLGHNSFNSLALLPTGGPWETNNYEGLWYSGPPVETGRRAIDLAGPTCIRPELSFWRRADWPSDGSITIYFYNTWLGYQWITDLSSDEPEWTKAIFDLSPYKGQSGEIVFWHWGGNQTDGSGFWLDDIRVGERAPEVDGLRPNSGFVGDEITIVGSGFGLSQGASEVFFKDAASADLALPRSEILSWNDTEIRLLVPGGAASGDVRLWVDQQDSNAGLFQLSNPQLDLRGIEPLAVYLPADSVPLSFMYQVEPESIEVFVDGESVGTMAAAPFNGMSLPLAGLKNGTHEIHAVSQRKGQTAVSTTKSFQVFSLQGDVNGDGVVNADDVEAMRPYIGMSSPSIDYRPWLDPDLDGDVDEADVSYIGYHFGATL